MLRMRSTLWALAPVVAIWLLAGCSGGGGGEQAGAQEEEVAGPITGEFVGDISEADAFVSLVTEEFQEQGSEEREVRGYLCDGGQLNEWFSGTVTANEVQLASPNGVQLDATLAPEAATGTITLSDGNSVGFEAPLATGIDGFYPVNITSEGQVSGTSWSGSQLEGSRSAERISGTITPPEGEAVDFQVSDPNVEEGEDRWIVLSEDGQPRIKGAKRKATSSGFIDPVTEKSPGGSPGIVVDYIDE